MKAFLQQFFYKSSPVCFLLIFISSNARVCAQTVDSVIFEEAFDRTNLDDFWKADASWSLKSGSAVNFIDGTGGILRTAKPYNNPSYTIKTTAHGFTDNYKREYRITFGQADMSNDSMYVLSYATNRGGIFTLSRSAGNIYFPVVLDEAVMYPRLNATDSYTFKISRYKSGLIQVYIDKGAGFGETPVLEAIDESYTKAGHIGWQVDTESFAENFYVDNIEVVKPNLEKLALREKSTEDDLITQVSAKSGKIYTVAKLNSGTKQTIDRNYTVTSVPAYLRGASFIQSAMADKKDVSDTFLTFFVKRAAIIYIGYDTRASSIPSWLKNWTRTGDSIATNDKDNGYLQVYSKSIESPDTYPFPFSMGGNLSSGAIGSEINYLVAAVDRPEVQKLQAEDAFLSGVVPANNHTGYSGESFVDFINPSNDYIEWTVNIDVPGTYNLSFKYTNGNTNDRLVAITDNGKSVETIPFSSTLSWSWWAYYTGTNIFLTPGVHKIRATATGSSGPNIDELSLYYQSSSELNTVAQKASRNNNFTRHLSGTSFKAYPNPITANTRIYYSLKEKTNVLLSIHSVGGQHLQRLVNAVELAGDYQVHFNSDKLSPGTYLYRLQTGNEIKTGKIIKQ